MGGSLEKPHEEPPEEFVLDEAFIAAATIKEPSARQRKGNPLSRRRAARRARRAERSRRRTQVAAWRSSDPGGWNPAPRRSRLATLVMVTVVLAVGTTGLALLAGGHVPGIGGIGGFGPDLFGGGRPAETTPVTAGPVPTINLDAPFAGSRAAGFADGAAGITLPQETAMGGFGNAEVARFQRRSRELVVAAHLDRRTLLGGSPDAFTRKLDPEQRRDFVRHLNDRNRETRTRSWVTGFAPGTAQLAGSVIKVSGTTRTSVADRDGRHGVLVKFNYLFVYPVYRPGDATTLTRVVAHFEGEVFNYREAGAAHSWISRWGASKAPARCDVDDGFVHPYYPDRSAPDRVDPSGPPQDPYDLAPEDDKAAGCHASKAT